jgi:hypothetical protein
MDEAATDVSGCVARIKPCGRFERGKRVLVVTLAGVSLSSTDLRQEGMGVQPGCLVKIFKCMIEITVFQLRPAPSDEECRIFGTESDRTIEPLDGLIIIVRGQCRIRCKPARIWIRGFRDFLREGGERNLRVAGRINRLRVRPRLS